MEILLTRMVEYYEVTITAIEDSGKYFIEREPMNRLETRYLIENDQHESIDHRTRPFINITKEIEKAKKNEKELLLKLQGAFIKSQREE